MVPGTFGILLCLSPLPKDTWIRRLLIIIRPIQYITAIDGGLIVLLVSIPQVRWFHAKGQKEMNSGPTTRGNSNE